MLQKISIPTETANYIAVGISVSIIVMWFFFSMSFFPTWKTNHTGMNGPPGFTGDVLATEKARRKQQVTYRMKTKGEDVQPLPNTVLTTHLAVRTQCSICPHITAHFNPLWWFITTILYVISPLSPDIYGMTDACGKIDRVQQRMNQI